MIRGSNRLVLLLALVLPACAEREAEPPGQIVFERHCAACHGLDGKGGGPLAGLLTPKPADLTQLAQKSGGRFDEDAVMSAIDGRRAVDAHGPRDMPVWGSVFETELGGEPYPRYTTFLKIRGLADYLRSIQAPAG
jgi:mono/diheme cytochrome c family protein